MKYDDNFFQVKYIVVIRWLKPEILTEISHLTYRELYEVKVVTQLVKIVYTLDPFKPKQGKGKNQKRKWSSDKKKGEQLWGKIEVS